MLPRVWYLLIVIGMSSSTASGQDIARPSSTRDFALWRHAVESHAPATRDAAVADIARWTQPELTSVLSDLSRLPLEERTRLIVQGLTLHTDVAIAHRTLTGYDLPRYGPAVQIFFDGRAAGQSSATFHWAFARQLIERLPRGEPRTRIARLFYYATGALLQGWTSHVELDAHLLDARRVLGSDAVLLLYEGTRNQYAAHPRAQAYFDARRQEKVVGPPRRTPAELPSMAQSRADAEQAFRGALALDPTLHEARIRLAHILFDRARYTDALAELQRVPVETLPTLFAYYAWLVKGRAERALGRFEAATASFESALILLPDAQAPHVALSDVALATGNHEAARRQVLLLTEGKPEDDPWWWLGRVHANVDTAMRAMREGFR